jgi:hypothetical protein
MLLALLLFSGSARAQAESHGSVILLTVAAPPSDAEKLEAVAKELLERLEMQVELRRVERIDVAEVRQPLRGGPAYFARVWIAFAKSGRARLYLEHAARDRVLVRDVEADAHNPELVREELGHILQNAVEGLKAGEEIGAPRGEALKEAGDGEMPPETPPPSKPKPEPEPEPEHLESRARSWRFGPRYELVWLGDGQRFEDGPGAVFGAIFPTASRVWGLELAGFFRRPLKIEQQPVGARLQSLALDALITFEIWRGPSALFRLGAGAEADLVRVSPFAAAGQDVELAKSRWLKVALGRVAFTYAHDLGRFMDVEVTLGAELDPGRTRYVFQQTGGATDVLSPWPVRPLVSLGATVP